MDQERLEKIEFGQEYMNSELLTYIEKFKTFDSNTNPVVTILCSDNRLLIQMEKMTNDYSKINFHVCGTFNGIEDAVEKAEFSDAIIVNTLALKIAPDGLYKVLKSIEELGKDVYFILSGWESLPKNSELCKNKLAQIDNEFPFSKIKASRNVFIKQLEGFAFAEDVMRDYSGKICESFTFIHNVQIEALYKKIRREVQKFREQLCIEIQKEQAIVLQLHQNLMAKQKRYEITFSHATVSVNDTLDHFERIVKNVDIDEVLCALETDFMSSKERYLDNPGNIEREVKSAVFDKIASAMDSFSSSTLSGTTMSSKTGLQVDEAMNDLLSVTGVLRSCRFIDRIDLDELEQKIRETSDLFLSARNYDNSVFTVMDRVKGSLRAKITGFQFETLSKNEIKAFVENILSKAPNFIEKVHTTISNNNEEDNNKYEQEDNKKFVNKEKFIDVLHKKSEAQNEDINDDGDETIGTFEAAEISDDSVFVSKDSNYAETMEISESEKLQEAKWNHFCSEVQRLIDYSKNALSVLISDNSRIINEEIDVQSKNTVTSYFGFIIEKVNYISDNLKKQLSEYGRTDL